MDLGRTATALRHITFSHQLKTDDIRSMDTGAAFPSKRKKSLLHNIRRHLVTVESWESYVAFPGSEYHASRQCQVDRRELQLRLHMARETYPILSAHSIGMKPNDGPPAADFIQTTDGV
jgi:hypothetical protein